MNTRSNNGSDSATGGRGIESPRATIVCPECQTANRVRMDRVCDIPKCGSCKAVLHLDRPIEASDQTLERLVRESEVPVLVDIFASWCAPCKMMEPLLNSLATEMAGEVIIAKLDTDRNPAMAVRFQVRGIPTIIAFQGGREVARQVGVASRPEMLGLIEEARQVA